jgi:hypothetical protein
MRWRTLTQAQVVRATRGVSMACVIGLDFGTHTVRAMVADAACRALGRHVERELTEIEARS